MSNHITRTDDDGFGMGGLANAPAFPGEPKFSAHVEAQEARGQRELVESTDLPTNTHGTDDAFLALGFTFGDPHPRDPMFRPATLPSGWRKDGSGHAMWSYIVDEKGRQRVSIFYKAAFYDRDAFMGLMSPTAVLRDLVYADELPAALPLDDLLTADAARIFLEAGRTAAAERVQRYSFSDVVFAGDALARAEAELARYDALIGLLP